MIAPSLEVPKVRLDTGIVEDVPAHSRSLNSL